MLCVLTNHCASRSRLHEREVTSWRRNAIGNGRKFWHLGEPPDDGRLARCPLTHCHRVPLESYSSQVRQQWHGVE
ncbi:MAG TPA: hypothetical protein VFA10_25295 [Ktedonobacteraceae bacterium]|nr:hypothetical protein [Ktedonobacteraceae bacterium]